MSTETRATAEAGSSDGTEAPLPGSRFSATIYEPVMWLGERLGMRDRRQRLLSTAEGRVLEIGAGTGLNAEHYSDRVSELILAEPVAEMAEKIRAKRPEAEVVLATAEELPFEDDSFDTVVSTLVLCTVADPERAVSEIRRVLRPGGKLLFCEHVRAASERLARWQDRLRRPWAAFADGCQCNRDTLATIDSALEVRSVQRERWRAMPPIVAPLIVGEAVA